MNLPNILSLIRLCMVPLVPLVYFSDLPHSGVWAGGIYALASLTDILDGYIARKYNLITRLGRVLDPMADKLMSFCVLVCIIINDLVPFWAGVVFFVKEALMSLGALVQYKRIDDVPPSNRLGKFSTAFFFVTCFFIMLFPSIDANISLVAISAALTLNITAFFVYLVKFIKNTRRQDIERQK